MRTPGTKTQRAQRTTAASVILRALCASAVVPLLSSPSSACTSTPDCLRRIEAAQRDTRTISARFVQTKHVSLLDQPLTSSGRFYFQKPDRVRLEIEEPVRTVVVVDGPRVQIPDLPESERQAVAMAPMAAMFTQLGAIFSGSTAQLESGFEVSASSPSAGTIEVVLVPKVESWRRLFGRIDIRFAGEQMMARELRLQDALGDRLEVKMDEVKRNEELPASLFALPAETPQ